MHNFACLFYYNILVDSECATIILKSRNKKSSIYSISWHIAVNPKMLWPLLCVIAVHSGVLPFVSFQHCGLLCLIDAVLFAH